LIPDGLKTGYIVYYYIKGSKYVTKVGLVTIKLILIVNFLKIND